jgi:hypothetical protein
MRAIAGLLAASAAFVTAGGAARADADALVDHLGPREIAVGESRRASAIGAQAVSLNPAGLPLTRELVFEGGYGYRPSDSASIVGVSACDSTNAAPGCFFYQYVNASPELDGMSSHRRSHTAGLTLARPLGEHFILGTAVRYFDYNSDVMGEEDSSGINWDLGATARLGDRVNLGVVGYNLYGEDSVQYPRAIGAGALVRPLAALSLSADGVWNLDADDSTGRYGGGLEYFFSGSNGQSGYPIRGGAVHDVALESTYLTAGLGIQTMKVGFDVGGRFQVDGDGDEKLFLASLRIFGPRAEPGY